MQPIRNRLTALLALIAVLASALTISPAALAAPSAAPAQQRIDLAVTLRQSDSRGLSALFELPRLRTATQTQDGLSFTRLLLPQGDNDGGDPAAYGTPEVPFFRKLVAVPQGTRNIIVQRGTPVVSAVQEQVLLYPQQPPAVDQAAPGSEKPGDFRDPPFQFNRASYTSTAPLPADTDLVRVTRLGRVRDLELVAVDVAAAQYNPARRTLTTFSSVPVGLTFEGGSGYFATTHSFNPFERQTDAIAKGVLNYETVIRHLEPVIINRVCWGSEFLIITPKDFRPAADALRTWKNDKGISTVVVETGSDPGQIGTTRTEIQKYIRDRYNNCLIRLSYVLLLGDAEFIPPWYRNNVGTDLDYGLLDNSDILPDLAVGRMPVDTLAQAQTVVDKTIAYEKNPPFNLAFYRNISLASYFQCCRNVAQSGVDQRWFIETSELVRNQLLSEGYTAQRIYDTDTGYADFTVADPTPRRYYDGTALPADLAPASGFAWNGTSNDIVNAFNAGRFLVMHRGHGWSGGWGAPGFGSGNLASLTNGALTPVVFSVNCSSGYFDNETDGSGNAGTYFAERILRMQGGAVGVLGDTRDSPTVQNNTLTRGFFDAIWPDTLPTYGGNTSLRRLGDILNYSKLYMVNQHGIGNSNVVFELAAWHVYGDPTLEMWTGFPYVIKLPTHLTVRERADDHLLVAYEQEGATITVLQDGQPVGRAQVVNGVADIRFLNKPDLSRPLEFSAAGADSVSQRLEVK